MTNRTPQHVSRLAPSPTGALHLGNVRTFLVNWALARRSGWHLPLRIEDLDSPRIKPESVRQIHDIFAWLGITFDGIPITQSHDLTPYRTAMRTLAERRHLFACTLTRAEIEHAASAPHAGDHELVFPRHLRPDPTHHPSTNDVQLRDNTNYRFIVNDENITIHDRIMGRTTFRPRDDIGDFIVWTRRGTPAYQLAVVVDDIRQHVTDVVRGDDLLPSAARQTLLYRALGHTPPDWWHLPLVYGTDGLRLAKRHGDTRITTYRDQGVRPERVIGLMARWSGVDTGPAAGGTGDQREMTADAFAEAFDLDRLPRTRVVFTREDDAWLQGGSS
jgi:glutamyl-tRNA synthetase